MPVLKITLDRSQSRVTNSFTGLMPFEKISLQNYCSVLVREFWQPSIFR